MGYEIIAPISQIATIIGTIVAMPVAVFAIWKFIIEKNADKRRASENLYNELEDAVNALNSNDPKNWLYANIKEKDGSVKTVYFINKRFNHDFYDSLIFSGKINFLESKIQQPIQDIFKLIKIHNEYLTHANHLIMERTDSTVPNDVFVYCEWMHENEPKMEKSIQDMMEKLKEYFKMYH